MSVVYSHSWYVWYTFRETFTNVISFSRSHTKEIFIEVSSCISFYRGSWLFSFWLFALRLDWKMYPTKGWTQTPTFFLVELYLTVPSFQYISNLDIFTHLTHSCRSSFRSSFLLISLFNKLPFFIRKGRLKSYEVNIICTLVYHRTPSITLFGDLFVERSWPLLCSPKTRVTSRKVTIIINEEYLQQGPNDNTLNYKKDKLGMASTVVKVNFMCL